MGEAFVYMMFVGAGTSTGVAIVAGISYKVFTKMRDKEGKKKRKGALI